MTSMLRVLGTLTMLLALSACSPADTLAKFASPQEQEVAKSYIDLLRHHDLAKVESAIDDSIRDESLHKTLSKMADLFPSGQPTSITLVGAHRLNMNGANTVNLTFEYNFSGEWLLANVAVKTYEGKATIVGFNVEPQESSLADQHKFTLSGKSPAQYAVLMFAVFSALLTLYALTVCAKSKFVGRKWPWVLFVLLGVGKFAVNWTTGAWTLTPLAVQLFSASAFAPLYGPWTIAASVPVGAIVFLLRRRRLIGPKSLPDEPVDVPV